MPTSVSYERGDKTGGATRLEHAPKPGGVSAWVVLNEQLRVAVTIDFAYGLGEWVVTKHQASVTRKLPAV